MTSNAGSDSKSKLESIKFSELVIARDGFGHSVITYSGFQENGQVDFYTEFDEYRIGLCLNEKFVEVFHKRMCEILRTKGFFGETKQEYNFLFVDATGEFSEFTLDFIDHSDDDDDDDDDDDE